MYHKPATVIIDNGAPIRINKPARSN